MIYPTYDSDNVQYIPGIYPSGLLPPPISAFSPISVTKFPDIVSHVTISGFSCDPISGPGHVISGPISGPGHIDTDIDTDHLES